MRVWEHGGEESAQHLGSPGVPYLLQDEDINSATAPQFEQP